MTLTTANSVKPADCVGELAENGGLQSEQKNKKVKESQRPEENGRYNQQRRKAEDINAPHSCTHTHTHCQCVSTGVDYLKSKFLVRKNRKIKKRNVRQAN